MTPRQYRRSLERSAHKSMRRLGCTCEPTLEHQKHPQFGDGLRVVHVIGCPLGDWADEFNLRGSTPVLLDSRFPSRCQR